MTDLENQPTWKYIVAWMVFIGSVNLMILGIESFFVPYLIDGQISIDAFLWISVFSMLPLLIINCYVTYEKLFFGLNPYSIWKWLVGLGTLFVLSNLGNSISDLEESVADATPYILTQLIIWIIFLILYRHYFKEVKKTQWK